MPISNAYEARIRERWREIEPAIIVYLKSRTQTVGEAFWFTSTMTTYQEVHRDAIIAALDMHIPFRAIRLYNLDDPRLSEDDRAAKRQKFLEIRRQHPGRTPSLGRQNSKRPPAIPPDYDIETNIH